MLKLALRSVFRHRLRSGLTLAAIIVSVAGLILTGGFVEDIFVQLGEAIIHSQSGHIQVAKRGYFTEGSAGPDKYFIDNSDALRRRIASLSGVEDVMTRLSFYGLVNNGRSDLAVIVEGIEPDREARMGTSIRIAAGRDLASDSPYGMLIGEGVAQALNLTPGDSVTIVAHTPEGAMNSLEFQIAGIFETYSKDYDARAIKVALPAAQELLNASVVNTLVIELDRTSDTDAIAAEIERLVSGQGLEVKRWQALNDFYDKTVKLYDRQLGVLRLIVLLMVLLAVANAIGMTVYERTGELGTMRALGNRSRTLFALLMTEGLILGLIGSAGGVVFGVALAKVISWLGIPMPPPPNANLGYIARIQVGPTELLIAFLVGLIATTAASYLPTRHALRVSIVDALRENV